MTLAFASLETVITCTPFELLKEAAEQRLHDGPGREVFPFIVNFTMPPEAVEPEIIIGDIEIVIEDGGGDCGPYRTYRRQEYDLIANLHSMARTPEGNLFVQFVLSVG